MPKYVRGVEPLAFRIGEQAVLRKYLGDILIWDGTRSAVATAIRATATATARTAEISASSSATALVATAGANSYGATATASATATATAAAASALARDAGVQAAALADALAATATAELLDATAEENFNATANATAALATATLGATPAVGAADALAGTTAAAASALVRDAQGGGSGTASATAAAASALVRAAGASASSSAPALAATAEAAGRTAVPSASAAAGATAATASALVKNAAAPTSALFSDDFNRTAGTALGSNWVETGNDIGITANALAVQGTSTSPARRGAVWATTTNTHYQFVEFTLVGPVNANVGSGAILRCNAAMTEMITLLCASGSWSLGSITGINGTFTSIKTQSVSIAAGSTIRVEVNSSNEYRVYINGVQSGTTVTSSTYADTNHRYLGLWNQRDSFYGNGSPIDNFIGGDLPPPTMVASDDFNRASLGSNWSTYGGGTLYISGGEISGVGTPSEPISYAFWNTPLPSDTQIVKAVLRWGGRVPEHSAVSVALRANPASGHYGVHFWCVSNLMGISWFDPSHPNGYLAATGTEAFNSITQYAEGSVLELRAVKSTYTAFVNGVQVLQGSFTPAQVPYTNHYAGVQIQDDSAVSGGGQPPANLDDWSAWVV